MEIQTYNKTLKRFFGVHSGYYLACEIRGKRKGKIVGQVSTIQVLPQSSVETVEIVNPLQYRHQRERAFFPFRLRMCRHLKRRSDFHEFRSLADHLNCMISLPVSKIICLPFFQFSVSLKLPALLSILPPPLPPSFKLAQLIRASNRPFPSCLVPLFESEAKCTTFHMKMSFICT